MFLKFNLILFYMNHLFVARHGNYNLDRRLDYYGRQQMEVLGKAIKEILNGGSARVISSTAPRARDSSEVLIEQLALPEFKQVPYLWSGNDAPEDSFYYNPDRDRLMKLVNERREGVNGLVMVTHLEVAEELPSYFLKKELGKDEYVGEISKGQAVHLDLEEKNYQILPRR